MSADSGSDPANAIPICEGMLSYLEDYLVQQGLQRALPVSNRLPPPLPKYWAFALSIVGFLSSLIFGGLSLRVLLGALLPLLVYWFTARIVALSARSLPEVRPRTLVRLFLTSTALLSAGCSALVTQRCWALPAYLGSAVLAYIPIRIARFEQYTVMDDLRQGLWRSLTRSLRSFGRLIPIVMVGILLLAFSSELWQAIGVSRGRAYVLILALAIVPGVLVALGGGRSIADRLRSECPDPAGTWVPATCRRVAPDTTRDLPAVVSILERDVSWRDLTSLYRNVQPLVETSLQWRVWGRLAVHVVLVVIVVGGYLGMFFR